MKEWRARQSPEKKKEITARTRAWARARPNQDKIYNLRNHYGMTLDEYTNLLDQQNHVCAICKKAETRIDKRTGKPRSLSVDHCHTTGRIRGLLCGFCNGALGFVNDDIEVLETMIQYLKDSQEK